MRTLPARSARRGMTLLELIIAVSILAALFGAVFAAINQMMRGMSSEITSSALNQETSRGLERMMERLRSSKFTPPGGTTPPVADPLPDAGAQNYEYFVPVDWDNDGDTVDDNLAVDWGQEGPRGVTLDAVTNLRFVKTATYDEKTQKFDLNRDGDMNDSFDIGHLEEALYSTTKVTGNPTFVRPITPDIVIQVAGQTVGDINSDGNDDPIFQFDSGKLKVKLFVTNLKESSPIFQLFETSIPLRNW